MQPKACETCGAPASWGVADLQEAELVRVDGQLLTVLTVRVIHWWCDLHHRVGIRYTRAGVPTVMR